VAPAAFIAAAEATYAAGPLTFTILTPPATKVGDSMIALIGTDSATSTIASSPAGWTTLATYTTAARRFFVLRKPATDEEPASHVFTMSSAVDQQAVMLVYRGLDTNFGVIEGSATQITTSTSFICPSRTLVAYSDLYLGIAFVSSAAVAVTNPGGTTERHDATDGAIATSLEVFELLPEATGATGTKTATTAATQSGLAVSILLSVLPPVPAQSLVPDVPGAIGFTSVGV
jgi:hypothetical protein